jgi:hypothetical protein
MKKGGVRHALVAGCFAVVYAACGNENAKLGDLCEMTSQCQSRQVCVSGQCTIPCTETARCPAAYECRSGYCAP